MNKQAGAIVIWIVFAMGTTMAAYAVETSKPLQGSNLPKVQEGSNAACEGGSPCRVVTGQALKIDGKAHVVKDQSMLTPKLSIKAEPK